MRFVVYCPRVCGVATALARELGGIRTLPTNSRYKHCLDDVVINWGSSKEPSYPITFNPPWVVAAAINKLMAFREMEFAKIRIPLYTELRDRADVWAQDFIVFGRDSIIGHGGAGITVYKPGEIVNNHKFYTRYIYPAREFRIHVLGERIVFMQEKLRRTPRPENYNKYIRSDKFGWVFAFKHLEENPIPEQCKVAAINAVRALSLDFGGVDVAVDKQGRAWVYEVNTAPGLEGSSLKAWGKAFKELYGQAN